MKITAGVKVGAWYQAHHENGVLQLAIPKSNSSKLRKIDISPQKDSVFSKLLSEDEKSNVEYTDTTRLFK